MGRDIKVPIAPFPGVMGVALDEPGGHSTMPPRKNGGNMDIKQLVAGTTLSLPVWVDGALFSVGDAHAAQGDGEVCVTAVEMMGRVTLRFGLESGRGIREPQFRTRGPLPSAFERGPCFATTAHGPDLFADAQQAIRYMIEHLVEERGFESLFVTVHTHIPTSRRSPFAGGGPLPKEYSHTLDPFVGLTAAAAATRVLKVGTGICLVVEHDPITLAKTIASLDLLSNGRFLFGIGAGWNAEEMENHGTVFKTRFRLLRERVLAMKEIWTKEAAEFHGDYVNFDPIWSYPKPVQKPHPPVLLGGESGHTLQRVVDFCDGWFPRGRNAEAILPGLADLKARAARAGRDPESLSVSVFGAKPERATLDAYAAAGITRVILRLPSEGRDAVLALLDEHAKLIR